MVRDERREEVVREEKTGPNRREEKRIGEQQLMSVGSYLQQQ